MVKNLTVTVGIPTKERPEELAKCIHSVVTQTLLPIEIIIVDDGNLSLEEQEHFSKMADPTIRFNYIKKDKASLSASKNLIAKLAKGNLVLIIDDDVVLESDYIKNTVAVFLKDSNCKIAAVGGVCINQKCRPLFKKVWTRMFLLDSPVPGGITATMFESSSFNAQNECKVKWLPGFNTVFRRDILRNYLFEEFQGGRNALEDIELAIRITIDYCYVVTPEARVYHFRVPSGEAKVINGFKHAYNRCFLFAKYGRKGFNKILFVWSFLGLILGLVFERKLPLAKGNVLGVYRFMIDNCGGKIRASTGADG